MAPEPTQVVVRVAGAGDAGAIALLRSLWTGGHQEPGFDRRIAEWLAGEGERRTVWLAELGGSPAGMASLAEYRRMPRPGRPDERWGYVGNVFVREDLRNHGIGSALLGAIIAVADERGYARLVLRPTTRARPLFRRAGFVVPDESADEHGLLVRPGPPG